MNRESPPPVARVEVSSGRDGDRSPLKLIYILGWGRSGSTLLANILGSVPGFFSAGEIHYLWSRGLLEERRCGCGVPVAACPVWSRVLEQINEEYPWAKDPSSVVSLQQRVIRNRHVPRLLLLDRGRGRRNEDLDTYRSLMGSLLHAIRRVTGARVIIDSTKRVPDALAVRSLPGVDAHFVHLVRDPRASAFSWSRAREMPDTVNEAEMRRFSTGSSSLRWLLWSGCTDLLGRAWGHEHFSTVRYESFIESPKDTVDRILASVGETPSRTPFSGERTVQLGDNHTVSGNPSRFRSGAIELRVDDEWIHSQTTRDRLVATSITRPLLRRYGYPVRPKRSRRES